MLVCVWCAVCGLCVLRHAEKVEKPVCGFKNASECTFKFQNVPVYAGTPCTCVSTCARGAGTHGYVLNAHTEAFSNPHTDSRRQFCLPRKAHVEFSLGPREVHQRNCWIIHIFSVRIDREQHVPDSSSNSLYIIKLFSFSNLEGNLGGNQQPDGSIGLSPSLLPLLHHHHDHHHNTQHTTQHQHKITHNTRRQTQRESERERQRQREKEEE